MAIKTACGLVQGVETESCLVYKGIPYAQPPIGDLRWKAPQPCQPWEGVLVADHSTRSVQRPRVKGSFYDIEFGGGESDSSPITEDCLYLNIWTPKDYEGKNLPVAINIHGGAFMAGCGHEKQFDGTSYTQHGVILVSINYRLGVFGFMAHPELSAETEQGTSGNYGILDQIAAIRWVKENIAAFGGDPDNITIFGQSAGGMSVKTLCSTSLTQGLYKRAIIQSGLGLSANITLAEAEADGLELAKLCNASSLSDLRALPTDAVTAAAFPLIMKGFQPGGRLMYQPIVDGYVLTDTLANIEEAGKMHDIPYIVGSNKNDMLTEKLVGDDKGPMYNATDAFSALITSLQTNPVYTYYFTRQLPGDQAGAFHSAELWYTFSSYKGCWRPLEDVDYALAERMTTAWTNFMKTGDPGWAPYGTERYTEIF